MFETIWKKKKNLKFFESPEGKIAFIETDKGYFWLGGNAALNSMAGGPLAAQSLVNNELELVSNKKPICGYYISEAITSVIAKKYKTLHLGFEYLVDIGDVDWGQPYFKRINNYAKRNDYTFLYYEKVSNDLFKEIQSLEVKSESFRRLPNIGFILSEAEKNHTEWAVVKHNNTVVAAIGLNKVSHQSYYTDNILSSKERMAMDFCLLSLLVRCKKSGIKKVNLGAVPFEGIKSKKNIFYWGKHFNWLYSSKGLAHFKKTYATSKVPVFCFFDRRKNTAVQLYRLSKLHFS